MAPPVFTHPLTILGFLFGLELGGPRTLTLKEATTILCLFLQMDLPGEYQATELSPELVSKRISALHTLSAHKPQSPPRKETLL